MGNDINKIANSENNYDMIISSIKKRLHENKYESKEHYTRLVDMCSQMGEFLNLEKTGF